MKDSQRKAIHANLHRRPYRQSDETLVAGTDYGMVKDLNDESHGGRMFHHFMNEEFEVSRDNGSKTPLKLIERFRADGKNFDNTRFGPRPDHTWQMGYNAKGSPTGWEKTVGTVKRN